jgi:ABC-type lipoprotein export system ATPase subunit
MVTHEPDIAAYAGRLIIFTDGRITRDEPVAWNQAAAAEAPMIFQAIRLALRSILATSCGPS